MRIEALEVKIKCTDNVAVHFFFITICVFFKQSLIIGG